jgi:hypothetical protein
VLRRRHRSHWARAGRCCRHAAQAAAVAELKRAAQLLAQEVARLLELLIAELHPVCVQPHGRSSAYSLR